MGVGTKIVLSELARVHNVAKVVGLLAGLPATLEQLTANSVHLVVQGVEVKSSCVATCADILLRGEMIDGQGAHSLMYHFEGDGQIDAINYLGSGGRVMLPRSTPFWITIGRELVRFFGGYVDFNDSDEVDCDFAYPVQRDVAATDGAAWDNFQRRMFALKPLTKADLKAVTQYAGYE